jgi:cellulose synthase operon protein YhjQ
MDTHLMSNSEEPLYETPEDVAILYSWANLHGAKYRDFSASRREYRAQVRHRQAEELRMSELQAKAEAEAAAAAEEHIAREAELAARTADVYLSRLDRERALLSSEMATRRASAERVEAARRAEAAAVADAMARREEREIAEAHASAERQAARWADSEVRRRSLAGPQPSRKGLGMASDPYEFHDAAEFENERSVSRNTVDLRDSAQARDQYVNRVSAERRTSLSGDRGAFRTEFEMRRRRQGFRPDEASGLRPVYRENGPIEPLRRPNRVDAFPRETPSYPPLEDMQERGRRADFYPSQITRRTEEVVTSPEQNGPAWLYASSPAQPKASSVKDTLQDSRERVASRWYALKGVFDPKHGAGGDTPSAPRHKERTSPVLAVFSLAGGVGKTSLVATLGRTLSSLGEKILLADTTSHGLLPYYFGATELRPGVVRTFSPPNGMTDAPIHLVSYEMDGRTVDRAVEENLGRELARSSNGTHRILLDLNAASGWAIRKLRSMNPTVLVPLAPDMNSVIGLHALEKYFAGTADEEGRPILPYYVINQFDAALPLHLDVREVLRRQLGDRLLPFVISRAPSVSEALADGMTVVDYAPDSVITKDYLNVANWTRTISAPAVPTSRNLRWSER